MRFEYTKIPKNAIKKLAEGTDKDISTYKVYLAICSHAHGNKISCFPEISTLAEETGLKVRAVNIAIAKLQELKLIEVQKDRFKSKQWLHNVYIIVDKIVENNNEEDNYNEDNDEESEEYETDFVYNPDEWESNADEECLRNAQELIIDV